MVSPDFDKTRPRAGKMIAVLAVLAFGAGATVVAVQYRPWNLLRYGKADIPSPDLSGLEPPLAKLLTSRRDAVRDDPFSAAAWGALGTASDVHELYPVALESYARAEALDPQDWRWPYFQGLARRIGNQRAAIEDFRRAAALRDDYAPLHFYLGHGLLQTDELDAAAKEFARAANLDSSLVAPHLGLAKIQLARGDARAALAELDRAQSLGPKSEEIRWLYAQAWRAVGDAQKAQRFAPEGTVSPAPEPLPDPVRSELLWQEGVTVRFQRQRADIYLQRNEPERAVAELSAAAQANPQSAELAAALGDLHSKLGRAEPAVTAYERAIALKPDDAGTLASLGAALMRKGDTAKAIDTLRRALELDPKNVNAINNLASALTATGKGDEGLALFAAACEARPDDADVRFNYAKALAARKRFDEAREAFLKVLELQPDNLLARFELGLMLASSNDFPAAAEQFALVVEGDPARAPAHANLVHALRESERYKDAVEAQRRAVEALPANMALRAQLAWMLATSPDAAARNGGEAVVLAKALCDETKDENAELIVIHGAALAETGDFEQAVARVQRALMLLIPKDGLVTDQKLVNVIDRAQNCLKLFTQKTPFHEAP